MRYYIQMEKEREQPGGVNNNLKVKPVYLGQILNGEKIPRNIPNSDKKQFFEKMLKEEKMKLTSKNVEVNDVEKVYVMPNPVIGEQNPEERRLQPSIYKGEIKIPKRIRKRINQ